MKSNNVLPHLAVLGANVIYGITFTVAKDVMPEYLTPNAFILVRVTGAFLLFWMLSYALRIQDKVAKRDWLRLAIAGVLELQQINYFFFRVCH